MRELRFVKYIGDSVVVIGHHNADPDSIGAAQGVKELVEKLKPNTFIEIVMSEDISSLSKKIINKLELDIREATSNLFDTIIVVDSGGLNQLGDWENLIKKNDATTILIDHHLINNKFIKHVDLFIHDKVVGSTCELVFQLFEKHNLTPSIVTAKAMLAGILFDTKYFSSAKPETFSKVSKLLKNVGDISKVTSLLQFEPDISERIARLKTAKRLELYRRGKWIIVFSEISSYQASGARALLSLGADIAVVIGFQNKNEISASFRSTQTFYDETKIHLGKLVAQISKDFGGSGSGHPTAAGYNGIGTSYELKNETLKKIYEKIM